MARSGVIVRSQVPNSHETLGENDENHWAATSSQGMKGTMANGFFDGYQDTFDNYVAESWLPQDAPSWSHSHMNGNPWSPENVLGKSYNIPQQDSGLMLPNNFGYMVACPSHSQTLSTGYECGASGTKANLYSQSLNAKHVYRDQESACSHSTRASQFEQDQHIPPNWATSSFQIQSSSSSSQQQYGGGFSADQQVYHWSLAAAETYSQELKSEPKIQTSMSPPQSSPSLTLDWSASDRSSAPLVKSTASSEPPTKRKAVFESPVSPLTTIFVDLNQKDLEECVDVFENSPGALKRVKKRKKLDAPVRKAAREVRKAGACHQCRFRKRTCSTGTPCGSCLKNGDGLHDLKCQRESPFLGQSMHQYFAHSSKRRIINFEVRFPIGKLAREMVTVDGIGKISFPLRLQAQKGQLEVFTADMQNRVRQTEDPKAAPTRESSVTILDDYDMLGTQVEQWAVEYTSKFVHAAGPAFYSTTIAHILGEAYVKKGLPECDLVAAMLRVASLSFILRAGVKVAGDPSPRFRTVQAKIDTVLYQRLQLAEKDLMTKLQRLVFRSAGCLSRRQVYPVGLVLWQLLRFLCISSSHLSNIAQRFHSQPTAPADHQTHNLKLVLSTHLALFRSSNPLLLNVSETHNRDLLGHDQELIALGLELRDVVCKMREKGFPEMKGSITYRKEYFGLWRTVYAK